MPVETRVSTCALDCPDACSVLVTIENNRAAKLRSGRLWRYTAKWQPPETELN